jgi:hypothetical protein
LEVDITEHGAPTCGRYAALRITDWLGCTLWCWSIVVLAISGEKLSLAICSPTSCGAYTDARYVRAVQGHNGVLATCICRDAALQLCVLRPSGGLQFGTSSSTTSCLPRFKRTCLVQHVQHSVSKVSKVQAMNWLSLPWPCQDTRGVCTSDVISAAACVILDGRCWPGAQRYTGPLFGDRDCRLDPPKPGQEILKILNTVVLKVLQDSSILPGNPKLGVKICSGFRTLPTIRTGLYNPAGASVCHRVLQLE